MHTTETEPKFIHFYKKKDEYILDIDFDCLWSRIKNQKSGIKNLKVGDGSGESVNTKLSVAKSLNKTNSSNNTLVIRDQRSVIGELPKPALFGGNHVVRKESGKQGSKKTSHESKIDKVSPKISLPTITLPTFRLPRIDLRSLIPELKPPKIIFPKLQLIKFNHRPSTIKKVISNTTSKLIRPALWTTAIVGMSFGLAVAVQVVTPPLRALTTEAVVQPDQTVQAVSLEETTSYPVVWELPVLPMQHRLSLVSTDAVIFGQRPVQIHVNGNGYIDIFKLLSVTNEVMIKAQNQEWYSFVVVDVTSVATSELPTKLESYPFAVVIFTISESNDTTRLIVTKLNTQ